MADRYDDRSDNDDSEGEPSVFDLFEAPPSSDPNSFGKIPVIKDNEVDLTDGLSDTERKAAADVEAAGLQHWTAPPTGQVPAILSEKDGKPGLWGDVAGPSWHGDDPTWSGPDLADVFADTDSVRLDQVDEEDDEEEDDEYRRPASSPARSRPVDQAPTAAPPLAAAPGRRPPPVERPTATDDRHGAPVEGPIEHASAPVPHLRHDPAPSPEPRPGANGDRDTWPTSPDHRSRPEARPTAQPATPSARSDRADRFPPAEAPGRTDLHTPGDRPAPAGPATSPDHRTQPGPGGPSDGRPHPNGTPGHLTEPDLTAPANGTSRVDRDPGDGATHPGDPDRPERAERSDGRRGPARAQRRSQLLNDDEPIPSIDDIEFAESPQRIRRPGERSGVRRADRAGADRSAAERADLDLDLDQIINDAERPGGRNLPMAILVGAALVGVLLAAIRFGPETTLLLVVVAAVAGVMELYNAMRLAGLRPANLLGIVGTAAAPAAAYYRGDAALPLIVGLTVVFGSLWYLVGADTERPVLNLSLTMMGIFWVGGLAAFAGLMLRADNGVELLLAAIIITVVSDTMAYIGGRAYGRRPFHPASPNKTWEGTTTGFLGAVFAGFAIGITELGTLWDGNLVPAIALGAVVGLLAPIGDLAESVVKRDLGVKDMGQLLPGHGGVLDRVDALLFALPGAYYLALVSGLI